FKGWFVANVPIIWNKSLPPGLLEVPSARVFGLTIDPERLAELRQAREKRWGKALGNYADPDFVRREAEYAADIFDTHPDWRIVDVTDKPIEEIASEILALTGDRET
ncbi:MAG: kinase/pyrophosphorylase, partial [Anaerolineae bacterium]